MEAPNKSAENLPDLDFSSNTKATIEKELDKMKKIVNNINQMRVEAAYLESDLMLMIDATTWRDISELIELAPMTSNDVTMKDDDK